VGLAIDSGTMSGEVIHMKVSLHRPPANLGMLLQKLKVYPCVSMYTHVYMSLSLSNSSWHVGK
jgi:hypothetical protein